MILVRLSTNDVNVTDYLSRCKISEFKQECQKRGLYYQNNFLKISEISMNE